MRFARGVLQTPEGPIKLKKIGKGAFSTAYVEVREDAPAEGRAGPAGGRAGPKPRVFVFSGFEVVDKELLAMALDAAPNNPHLPKVERFGNVGDMNVYVMPLYNSPFRKADSPEGWKDFSAIKKCREQAWRDISQRGTTYREEYAPPIGGIFAGGIRRVGRPPDMTHRGYDVNVATVECAKASGVRPAVVEALDVLTDTASNYGASQVFEFAPRNLATDDEGNLVFLDPLFDMEQLERQRAEARRRAAAAGRARWNPMSFDVLYTPEEADRYRGSRAVRSILSSVLRQKNVERMANSSHNFIVRLTADVPGSGLMGTPGAVTLAVPLRGVADIDDPSTSKSAREGIYTAFTYLHKLGDVLYSDLFPEGPSSDPDDKQLRRMMKDHTRILEDALGLRASAAEEMYLDGIEACVNSRMVREGYSSDWSQAFADLVPLCELTPPSRPILLPTFQRPPKDTKRLPQKAYDVFNAVVAPDFNVRFRVFYQDHIQSLYGKAVWLT
jgi:hypothetical protein